MRKEGVAMKFVLIIISIALSPLALGADVLKTFCFYDLTDKTAKPSSARIAGAVKYLRKAHADVIVLAGLRSERELAYFRQRLGFRFAKIVNAEDPHSHLAMLAKIAPLSFNPITDQKYTIKKGVKIPVRRGFIHAIFDFNGYKLHVFGAQLKDRMKHPQYLHTNMRRYEARLLKKLVGKVIKKDKKANILVLADLNDTCGKSPVTAIYTRRSGIQKRMFDIRPLDSINVSWTFLDEKRDEYDRIDYALASFGLVPEIVFAKCAILETPNWRSLSSHRAIVVAISCAERKLWKKEKVSETFPHSIRSNEASIGIKERRGEPSPENPE